MKKDKELGYMQYAKGREDFEKDFDHFVKLSTAFSLTILGSGIPSIPSIFFCNYFAMSYFGFHLTSIHGQAKALASTFLPEVFKPQTDK